jgi:hypothetical protein
MQLLGTSRRCVALSLRRVLRRLIESLSVGLRRDRRDDNGWFRAWLVRGNL